MTDPAWYEEFNNDAAEMLEEQSPYVEADAMTINLNVVKREIEDDLLDKIKRGSPVNGTVLPKNPISVMIIGKSIQSLQARIVYDHMAPYYFDVTVNGE
jgi:hypothetical protein